MLRPGPMAALAATLLAAPVGSRGADLDLRCTTVDQTLSERLRAIPARKSPVEAITAAARPAADSVSAAAPLQ